MAQVDLDGGGLDLGEGQADGTDGLARTGGAGIERVSIEDDVLGLDHGAQAGEQGALRDVSQLADIAWPTVLEELGPGRLT